jgi:hypothetical protein
MSDTVTSRGLWCHVVGNNTPFRVIASSPTSIGRLKDFIKDKRKNGVLKTVDAKDLTLWRVRMISV